MDDYYVVVHLENNIFRYKLYYFVNNIKPLIDARRYDKTQGGRDGVHSDESLR